MTRRQTIFHRIGQVTAPFLLVAWFGWWGIEWNRSYAPRAPDPETGRTIPYQTRSITVYISKSEREFHDYFLDAVIAFGTIVALCWIFSGAAQRHLNPGRRPPQAS
jgi:hypothetical protein